MKLNYDRKSKNPTYFIQMGIRNGKKTTTKNVHRIGKHSDLLELTDDPLAYAKQLVVEFNDKMKSNKIDMHIKIDFDEKIISTVDTVSKSNVLNIGYFILQIIYSDLHIKDFIDHAASNTRTSFNSNDINRFLTFDRILHPRSKLATVEHLDSYFEKLDFSHQQSLRFMDILDDNYDAYIEHLFKNSNNVIKRDTSVCYFDCTNYYFECESADDDVVDEVTGEIIKGFRKYGPSKEHRPNPLVQMGLFMDARGIPISMCINPGSDNEQKSAIPLEKKMTKMFENKKFVYCADAGLGSINIRKFNDMGGRAFIVTQSVKKLEGKLKEAVFNDFDYKLVSNNQSVDIADMISFDKYDEKNIHLYNDMAYKVLEVDKEVDLGLFEEKMLTNGIVKKVKSKALLKQRVIITFSRKMMEYQRKIRNGQIERAKKLVDNQLVESVKKGPHDVTRFIKRVKGKGEKEAIYEIDSSIIRKEEMYDGYYAVATNLDDDVKYILEINSQRYKIEDCFRVLKTNLGARPINHRLPKRIKAHFLICYTSLLIERLLEAKLEDYGNHYTTRDIIENLKNMNVVNNGDMFYQSLYSGSDICTSLNGIFSLGLDKKYYYPKDINKKIRKISK
jgi:hypothetical protein